MEGRKRAWAGQEGKRSKGWRCKVETKAMVENRTRQVGRRGDEWAQEMTEGQGVMGEEGR